MVMDLAIGGWIHQKKGEEGPPLVEELDRWRPWPVEEGLSQAQIVTSVVPAARQPCHLHPTAPYRICSLHPAASSSLPMGKKGKAIIVSTSLPVRKKGKAAASRWGYARGAKGEGDGGGVVWEGHRGRKRGTKEDGMLGEIGRSCTSLLSRGARRWGRRESETLGLVFILGAYRAWSGPIWASTLFS
jgi:hypothetical protein